MNDVLNGLYEVVLDRRDHPQEGSYTCYLFEKGLDKILKKCGEECSEVIIAAKNGDNRETVLELSDLLYHLMVLMVNEGISLDEVKAELDKRSEKPEISKPFIRWIKILKVILYLTDTGRLIQILSRVRYLFFCPHI